MIATSLAKIAEGVLHVVAPAEGGGHPAIQHNASTHGVTMRNMCRNTSGATSGLMSFSLVIRQDRNGTQYGRQPPWAFLRLGVGSSPLCSARFVSPESKCVLGRSSIRRQMSDGHR